MPFIGVKVNTAVSKAQADAVKSALGQAITALPGKSEQWLMVGIEPDAILYFQGSDAPAAMVEVTVYGSASPAACDALTGKICGILETQLSIPAGRIYVRYGDTPNWGWNGGNF